MRPGLVHLHEGVERRVDDAARHASLLAQRRVFSRTAHHAREGPPRTPISPLARVVRPRLLRGELFDGCGHPITAAVSERASMNGQRECDRDRKDGTVNVDHRPDRRRASCEYGIVSITATRGPCASRAEPALRRSVSAGAIVTSGAAVRRSQRAGKFGEFACQRTGAPNSNANSRPTGCTR